jgi:hypothetical protein
LQSSSSQVKGHLQQQLRELREQLEEAETKLAKPDEAEQDEDSDCELVEWFDFLKWLKPWVESKPKKGQWTPSKADAEAILKNVRKSKEPKNE